MEYSCAGGPVGRQRYIKSDLPLGDAEMLNRPFGTSSYTLSISSKMHYS